MHCDRRKFRCIRAITDDVVVDDKKSVVARRHEQHVVAFIVIVDGVGASRQIEVFKLMPRVLLKHRRIPHASIRKHDHESVVRTFERVGELSIVKHVYDFLIRCESRIFVSYEARKDVITACGIDSDFPVYHAFFKSEIVAGFRICKPRHRFVRRVDDSVKPDAYSFFIGFHVFHACHLLAFMTRFLPL